MSKFDVWILVKESEDISGTWIAHCLDIDVVSQGNSPMHAYKMGVEAAQLAMRWDLEDDLDPGKRKQAPKESWEDLLRLIEKNNQLDYEKALDSDYSVIAIRVTIYLEKLAEGLGNCVQDSPVPAMRALAQAA